jgi:hypothetical protein
MIKKRRGSAKAALGQQRAELKRKAPGKRFIGEGGDPAQARAAERARVLQMQAAAARAAANAAQLHEAEDARREDHHSRLYFAGQLVRDTTRLARTVAGLPLRMASVAAGVPFRLISAVWLRPREA